MTTITVMPDKITVTGHSGYADPGKDIVCSAISVLVQTLSEAMLQLTDDVPMGMETKGISILYTEHLSEQSKLLVDAFLIGINGIAGSYPDNVKIIREDAPKP